VAGGGAAVEIRTRIWIRSDGALDLRRGRPPRAGQPPAAIAGRIALVAPRHRTHHRRCALATMAARVAEAGRRAAAAMAPLPRRRRELRGPVTVSEHRR